MLSLLLCMAVLALLIRSDGHRDELHIRWLGTTKYAIASERGELLIDNSPEIDDRVKEQERLGALDRLYQQRETYRVTGNWSSMQNDMKQFETDSGRALPVAIRYAIPAWWIALLALILPALWARKWVRHCQLVAPGLCPQCGYDLRASKDRCPECGMPIHAKSIGSSMRRR